VDEKSQIFHLSVVKSNFYHSVTFIHYFSFLVQELDVRLDDIIINQLVGFFNLHSKVSQDPKFNQMNHTLTIEPKKSSNKVYFSVLYINPFLLNLTFTYSNFPRHRKRSIQSSGTNVVANISSAIGITIANVDNAPIYLNALLLENAFHKQSEILRRIMKHYKRQAIMGVYKVIASFDIIGNPASLVHNLGTGVHDFFHEPYNGIVHSPQEFITGIGKGSTSLLKNFVVGLSGTTSNILRTVGKGASQATMDPEYVQARNTMVREVPSHVFQGIWWGTKEFTSSTTSAITGVHRQIVQGYEGEGYSGVLYGGVRGVVGLVVKPCIGAIDLATRVSQGIKSTAKWHEKSFYRVRPPRGFGPERLLMEYRLDKAIGHSILCSLEDSPITEEWHLFHCLSGTENQLLLVSNKNLFIVNIVEQDIDFKTSLSLIDPDTVNARGAVLVFDYFRTSTSWSFREKSEKNTTELELYSIETAVWAKTRLERTLHIIREFNQDEQSSTLTFSRGSFLFQTQ